jgi:hypothetical protein
MLMRSRLFRRDVGIGGFRFEDVAMFLIFCRGLNRSHKFYIAYNQSCVSR